MWALRGTCGAGGDADVVACGRVPVRPSLGEGHPHERRYHHSLVGWQLRGPYWKINVHLCIWSHLMKPDPVTWFLVHWVKVTLQLKSSTHQGGWKHAGEFNMNHAACCCCFWSCFTLHCAALFSGKHRWHCSSACCTDHMQPWWTFEHSLMVVRAYGIWNIDFYFSFQVHVQSILVGHYMKCHIHVILMLQLYL